MESKKAELSQKIISYVPEGTSLMVANTIVDYKIHLTITKHRTTKLGDYRPPIHGKGHRITLNKSLNPFSFLITFVHEVAHLTCWNEHKNKVAPHGGEWKRHFQQQMNPYLMLKVFPENVMGALLNYMQNPAASSCADADLMKALNDYQPEDGLIYLEELPENQRFLLDYNKTFQKGPLERKRFRCLNLNNKRYYFVNALARVKPIE